ncbi:hypothetical protein CTT30_12745 [Vibrio coralliilyticus]|nr:hypothetical protein CTT30_12745 [Vibrio coralliilyticus]
MAAKHCVFNVKSKCYQRRVKIMGCCNDKKACGGSTKQKRKIPWFSVIMISLLVLVIVNWQ